jgi:hypothetical protein
MNFPWMNGNDTSSDTTLSRQASTEGEFARFVIKPTHLHD